MFPIVDRKIPKFIDEMDGAPHCYPYPFAYEVPHNSISINFEYRPSKTYKSLLGDKTRGIITKTQKAVTRTSRHYMSLQRAGHPAERLARNINAEWTSEPQGETGLRSEVADAGFASVIMAESRSD